MSGTDLTDLLKRGAGPTPQGVDPTAVWQRGRRRRTITRLSAAAGAATVVAAVVLVQPFGGGPAQDISIAPADRPPTAESTDVIVVDDSEVMRLAAAATSDASVEDAVVSDTEEVAELWQLADIDGDAPVLPEGTVGLFVIARQAESTCRSTGDVTGVEVDDGAGVVLLDPDGEFLRPCPGPEGGGAFTAFVVALPDRYGQDLTEASTRLAPPADQDPGGAGSEEETGVDRPSVEETVAAPSGLGEEGSDVAETPQGRAELELLVDTATFEPDGQVELQLVNRGEVLLWHGLHVDLQRWTGDEWVAGRWPGDSDISDVSESLLPGNETHPRRMPSDAVLDPGWYRASWEARWEDDTGEAESVELRARTSFEVSASPSLEDAPAWYAQRDPMPSCGTFELGEVALANVELEEANQCLLEAFESGEPAELQVAQMTDAGDPIIETYRVIATGELEMMVDTRQDEFGNKGFYYAVCTDLYENRPRGGPTVRVADCVYDEDRTVRTDR